MSEKMIDFEKIGAEMRQKHFVRLSWQALGLNLDQDTTSEVITYATTHLVHRPAVDGIRGEARVYSEQSKRAARKLIGPVVNALFPTNTYARERWHLFAVNYYEEGTQIPPHRDHDNPTISTTAILSLCGVRTLRIEGEAIRQVAGDITLLDGGANPIHTAYCLQGPSISVVADIPELLY